MPERLFGRKCLSLVATHRKVTYSVVQTLVAARMHLPVYQMPAAAELAADQMGWHRIALALRTLLMCVFTIECCNQTKSMDITTILQENLFPNWMQNISQSNATPEWFTVCSNATQIAKFQFANEQWITPLWVKLASVLYFFSFEIGASLTLSAVWCSSGSRWILNLGQNERISTKSRTYKLTWSELFLIFYKW